MRTFLFCFILLTCYISTTAQTVLKPAPLSSLTFGGKTLSFEDTTVWAPRVQQHFLIGWQWAGPNLNTNKRLHCNFYQSHYGYFHSREGFDEIPDSGGVKYIVWQHLSPDTSSVWGMGGERGLNFDPTADTTFTARAGDTTGAVLGFKTRNIGYGSLSTSGVNFDRYSLDSVGFPAISKSKGVIVLDRPVIENGYYENDSKVKDTIQHDWSGRYWYLSLNLRRKDSNDISMLGDTLLTISIPYVCADTNVKDSVVFDSVSLDRVDSAYSLANGRGKILRLKYVVGGTNKFVITRKMLPNSGTRDITVSAFCRFKNNADSVSVPVNPWLQGGKVPGGTTYITNLGINVRYHGRNKLCIDWIRIATPSFEHLMFGAVDSAIWKKTYTTLDTMRNYIYGDTAHPRSTPRNMRLLAFYGTDEPPQIYYSAMRYYRDLMSGRFTSEAQESGGASSPMNCLNTWAGGITGVDNFLIPTPILKKGNIGSQYNFTIPYGYNTDTSTQDIGTYYETRLVYKCKTSDTADANYYKKVSVFQALSVNASLAGELANYEASMYGNFYLNNFAYGDRPWWTNIWGTGGFGYTWHRDDTGRRIGIAYKKQLTGEEMRSQIWTPILHGAKGLMYDRMYCFDTILLHTYLDTNIYWPFNVDTVYCDTCYQKYGKPHYNFQTGMMYDKSQIPDSLEGTSLIESDLAGPDFLWHGDRTHLDLVLDLDSVARAMQVPLGRVYMGRKSMRREVMKAHDFIVANDSILMKMKLVSWFGKGFYIFKTGDTTTFNKIVALDTHQISTRAPYRTRYSSYYATQVPDYESNDSTFYDIMLHRIGTTSLDTAFVLGVMNRYCSPLIVGYDTTHHIDTALFLTTAEFDSVVQWHPEKKYTQAGAREITIPFNYKDTLGRFALMRVRELTGTFDTIVGQDAKFSVKFLPGEGKLFKVEILRPNEVAGDLAHSNQTKICTYPIMRREHGSTGKFIETDTIVHYMTYHKQIPGRGTGWKGVFFRKSKPSYKRDNSAAIQWDANEYLLSDTVFHDSVPNYCDTCMYPSIVVRHDSLSQEYRSYVVYGCISDTAGKSYNSQYIVESVVRVANDTVVVGSWQGRAFEAAASRDLAEWGGCMLNASDTVNFYCWSDPYIGIRTGWKRPSSTPVPLVEAPWHIHWSNACGGLHTATHPSMNSYSRYMSGERENDCALVWQEYDGCGGYKQTFYTRLFFVNGHLRNGLSPHFINDTTSTDSVFFNADTSILFVSTLGHSTYYSNTFPVVYRDLHVSTTDTNVCNFSSYFPGYSAIASKFDRVFWQSDNFLGGALGIIKSRVLFLSDTIANNEYVPSQFMVTPTSTIWNSSGRFLDQPVVSAGEEYDAFHPTFFLGDFFNCYNMGQRAVNLNFRSRPWTMTFNYPLTLITIFDTLALIHHFPQYLFFDAVDATVSIIDAGRLSYPHLAERGSLKMNDWQRNHRIYNKRNNIEAVPAPPATIRSSAQYFYRTFSGEEIARKFYSFGDDSLSFGVSSVTVGDNEYQLKAKSVTTLKEVMKSPDTLSTEWFNVDNIETMDVITTGSSPDKAIVWLERQSDGSTWDIPLDEGERMKIALQTVELTNGDNENYRVSICSKNHSQYHPETAITDDNEESSFGKSNGKEYKQINLGDSDPTQTVFVYPNPARDEVNLTIKGTDKSEVIIVSAIGGEAVRFFADGGKTVTVNTSTFPSGMYVVRVRRGATSDIVVPFVVFR